VIIRGKPQPKTRGAALSGQGHDSRRLTKRAVRARAPVARVRSGDLGFERIDDATQLYYFHWELEPVVLPADDNVTTGRVVTMF
jgi:hypothetical protein